MSAELSDDNSLTFAHSHSVVSDCDFDISGLGKLSAVFTQL